MCCTCETVTRSSANIRSQAAAHRAAPELTEMRMYRARCACGGLKIEAKGEPYAVVVCHCRDCQRRTGSAFGAGVYFQAGEVELPEGARIYERAAPEGRMVVNYFCRECGTSLYWTSDLHKDGVAIALGAFDDPSTFKPLRSVWEQSKAEWVHFDETLPGLAQGRGSAPTRGG